MMKKTMCGNCRSNTRRSLVPKPGGQTRVRTWWAGCLSMSENGIATTNGIYVVERKEENGRVLLICCR